MTPGRTHFWPKEHNLNKLGRGLLDDIKDLGLVVSDKKIFLAFISKTISSLCDLDMQRTENI